MTVDSIRNKIIDLAIQGKLVPQNSEDVPAFVVVDKIRHEKEDNNECLIFKRDDGHYYESINGTERCIDKQIQFNIPKSWVWARLGSLVTVLGGKRIPAGRKLTSENTGHVYIRVSDMKDNSVQLDSLLYVPEDIYPSISRYIINEGDVYITVAGTIGKVGKIPPQLDGANLTENADRLVFRGINQDWLINYLSSSFIQRQIINATTKVGQPKLAIKSVENLLIAVPPLEEQERIVKKLEDACIQIENIYRSQIALENDAISLKKRILNLAIHGKLVLQDPDDEPASVLLERIRSEKEQMVKEGKIKKEKNPSTIFRGTDNKFYEKIGSGESVCIEDEIPFDIPDSWEWARLSSIVFNHGQKIPASDFCYIDIGSIDNVNHRLNENETIIVADKAPSRARKIVETNDILYSTVRPYLHNMCIINREFSHEPIASTGFAVLACFSGIYNEFLFYYMMAPIFDSYANHADNSKGIAYPAINDDRLYRALIPIPPISEQKKIVAKINEILPFLSEYERNE